MSGPDTPQSEANAPMSVSASISAADETQRALLERLWLMFRHDMSEFRQILPGTDGTFRSDRLDAALGDPGWAVYVLRYGDNPAGFALVRGLDEPRRVINSFFVVRGARRSGFGRAAVRALVSEHPGGWSVAFQDSNTKAVAFWRSVAEDLAPGAWTEVRRPVPGQPDLPPDVWIEFSAGNAAASGS